jgi:hypothetical protein
VAPLPGQIMKGGGEMAEERFDLLEFTGAE